MEFGIEKYVILIMDVGKEKQQKEKNSQLRKESECLKRRKITRTWEY